MDNVRHNRLANNFARNKLSKDLLKEYILRLLNEKPMTDLEIANEIIKRTRGLWIPDLKSIRSLLLSLNEQGFIREIECEEGKTKKYSLTEKGKRFLIGDERVERDVLAKELPWYKS